MALFYQPHQAAVYREIGGAYVSTGTTVYGQLSAPDSSAELTNSGWNQTEIRVFLFSWEDYDKIEMGDRILVSGAYYNVTTKPVRTDAVFILRNSRVQVEATDL